MFRHYCAMSLDSRSDTVCLSERFSSVFPPKSRLLIIGVLFLWLLITAGLWAHHSIPDTEDINGNPIYLSQYQGKWLFVNYWATWCHPCVEELPSLQTFYNSHSQNVAVVGVNFDQKTAAEIREFARQIHIDLPLLRQFPLARFGIREAIAILPSTYVFDPEGKFYQVLLGPQTPASLAAFLNKVEH